MEKTETKSPGGKVERRGEGRTHHRHINHFPPAAPPHNRKTERQEQQGQGQGQTSFDTFRARPPPPVYHGSERRNVSKQEVKRKNESRRVEWDVYRRNRVQTVGGGNYF